MSSEIDIVVTWLDSNDPIWQKNFLKFKSDDGDTSLPRFRDWNNFKFWFRAIEKNMSWIRKIHVVTNGVYPSWLNVEHKKINIVSHIDYIPSEYLPTFNSRVIELNLDKLSGLSDKFILFNDDFFVLSETTENDFFVHNKPCDCAVMNAHSGDGISNVIMNNLTLINQCFDKKNVIWDKFPLWFNYKYGKGLLRNICLYPWPRFTGFYEPHLPQPYLKSTLKDAWILFQDDLIRTSSSRFRLASDVNHFLFRYIQLAKNNFHPMPLNWLGKYFQISDDNYKDIIYEITNSNKKIIALNDGNIDKFELIKNEIYKAFEIKFPNKSMFEL
ncbi:stealth conserved region 3 domain-containing protein [Photobacterium leiognathi]|uniref:stealth conserved region 3 domain-containing protein n=1 Tax=Photobacterium leiognathi TaxID=553611 RepID=UPI002980B32B|nr:stealth conserved region 3 domain-containing protein [Photobacterium leiognathi]